MDRRSWIGPFVLGFACCGLTARLLLTPPVEAGPRVAFATADPADVVEAVGKTVVSIEAFPAAAPHAPGALLPLFGPTAGESSPSSVASGVVISPRGYIVTSQHVVSDAGSVRVRLADGREMEASVVGSDALSDLAVLRVRARNLKAVALGDSRRVRPGESVVAIGNPLGFENSVTLGVVSANRRGPIRVDGQVLGDMLQTDAAINQGNSGGGLFTADGRLVGINSAIMVPRGGTGSIGIGFAIPAHRVRPVADALITSGRVPRPWLGIRYSFPSVGTLVRRIRSGPGVRIDDVVRGSPAETAGIRRSDVVRRLGDCPIRAADDIQAFVERYRAGQRVRARVVRRGVEKDFILTLGESPAR